MLTSQLSKQTSQQTGFARALTIYFVNFLLAITPLYRTLDSSGTTLRRANYFVHRYGVTHDHGPFEAAK
jgi:hypothetical protein